MALVPKISLTLNNKCNKVTLLEETNPYDLFANPGGWGDANISTNGINYASVDIFPFAYNTATNASCTGSIAGTVFTDITHLAGVFVIGQTLTGNGIAEGTVITGFLTGTGSNTGGTYTVSVSQSLGPITITGVSSSAQFVLKSSSIDVYAGKPGTPTPVTFTALSEKSWANPDGIYEIVYKVYDNSTIYLNEETHQLFLCNLCNCKDAMITKLIDACDSIKVKELKEQVDQMEIFIYGIQSAFACGDFDTADNILTAASTYCQTLSNCGCGCGGNCK
jgi:hypothetical protein